MRTKRINIRRHREQLGLSQARLAELAEIPQYLLSAAELGKAELSGPLLDKILSALSDITRVRSFVTRRKRYKQHVYGQVRRAKDRIARAVCTLGNPEYVSALIELDRLHRSNALRRFSAVSLFAGCGGLSLGFSAAGFAINGFLELDSALRSIYRANFQSCVELGGNIAAINQDALRRYAKEQAALDVIIGGPPCQGFSLSGKRKVDDPRNSLFRHYLRFVEALKPKVAILENVRLLTSMTSPSGGFVKDQICEDFMAHGYAIRAFEINAKSYGVPQHRERVIFVAMRNDLGVEPSLPEETHGGYGDLFSRQFPYRTFGDACSDLPYLESGEKSEDPLHQAVNHPSHIIDWLWDVKEGHSAHDNEDENMRPPSGYNTTYKRQIWNEPASTVQTTFGMISGCRNVHPIATRSLTIREAARIQSFPDAFRFQGPLGTIRTGIGNAVPPLLAYAIANHVKTLLG